MAIKPNKSTKKKTRKIAAPQRSLLQEGRDALGLMNEAMPQLLANEQQYSPQFARAEAATAGARAEAERGVMDSQYGALRQSMLSSSPELRAANSAMTSRLGELGPSGIETALAQQAQSELSLGGQLTNDQRREADQSVRAALSARGMAGGTAGAVSEVLNRQGMSDARLQQRRQFAGGVDSMIQQRKSGDAAVANNTFNTLSAFWDPQQRLFGRSGSAVSGQVSGPNSFNPFLTSASNVGAGNQNASIAAMQANEGARQFGITQAWEQKAFDLNRQDTLRNQQMNNQAAQSASRTSAFGNIAGMIFGGLAGNGFKL
jgi:hypothetical protein